MQFVSYAQNFEDVMLWRALGHIENGFYIDIGANSPDEDTVTRAFYDRGWHGINVEPNPRFIAELNDRRPRDKNLGVAISNQTGNIQLYNYVENPGLATLDADVAKTHREAGLTPEIIDVRVQTLSELWQEHVDPAQSVHFLKVDVEGHEKEVLLSLDWSRFRPWIVVVEATYPMSQKEVQADWENILLEAGYTDTYWDGLNRYYVSDDHKDLRSAFAAPPNVFDDFVLGKYSEPIKHLKNALKALQDQESVLTAETKQAQESANQYKHQINVLQELLARATDAGEKPFPRTTKKVSAPKAPKPWHHFISVVVYGSENNQAALQKTLNSLLDQTYRNIEIIVVGSDLPRDCHQDDFMTLRGLIARPDLNAASFLKLKHHDRDYRGDYVFFAPAGTIFSTNCFELAVDAINDYTDKFPDLAVVDYDFITSDQTPSERVFLPGWDPEFALSTNSYRTAFLISRKLVERVRAKFDLTNLDSWISSVAKLHPQPEHAHISEPAIHFTKDTQSDQLRPRSHRVERPAGSNPTVSLIIPNRNRPDLLKSCLAMLDHIHGLNLDLIIVDNNSDDVETLDLYEDLENRIDATIVDAGAKFNYSRMVNLGVEESQSDFIALINNDVQFSIPGEFESLVYHAMRPEVGVVGARLFYPSGRIQHAGIVIDTGVLGNRGTEFRCRHVLRGSEKSANDPKFPQNADRSFMAVTGAVQVMKRDTYNSLGGYDEVYLPIEYNDVDFCLRAKTEGYRVLCVALEGVFHGESESRGKDDSPETLKMREGAMKVMLSRWGEFVENNPYGHPAIEVGDSPKPFVMPIPKSEKHHAP